MLAYRSRSQALALGDKMKHALVTTIVFIVTILPNTIVYPEVLKSIQATPALDEEIRYIKAGHLIDFDNMMYEVEISWKTDIPNITQFHVYRKVDNEDAYRLIETIRYSDGVRKYKVPPGRIYRYSLATIYSGEKVSRVDHPLIITTAWDTVSRDLSELIFINDTAQSTNSKHRNFALKALKLGIKSLECKEMLLDASYSDDPVIRAFAVLGLGYFGGWNMHVDVFTENLSNSDPSIRWAALSSLYYPKGATVRPWVKRKKEVICEEVKGLSNDKAQIVEEKISFILQYRGCSETSN